MIKFYDQLYVGIQKRQDWDRKKWAYEKTDINLGFATPYENNAAFQKRKYTVDSWAGKEGKFETIDNKPINGFTVMKTVSRYSTSNKLFRIMDPRGFQLEISAENLFQLIDTCTVEKGEIKDELIWGRDGQNNVLVTTDNEDYQKHLKPSNYTQSEGDYVVSEGGTVYRYMGKKYCRIIKKVEGHTQNGSYWDRKYVYTYSYVDQGRDTKPWHIYIRWNTKEDRDRKYHCHGDIEIRRSEFKDMEKYTGEIDVDVNLPNPPTWSKFSGNSVGWRELIWIFDDKSKNLDKAIPQEKMQEALDAVYESRT